MRKRLITYNDFDRLRVLLSATDLESRKDLNALASELLSATIYTQENISNSVITMNSRVRLIELSSGTEIELTITYPRDSKNSERKVSVISDIGIALLGRVVGDVVTWKIPNGYGRFEIKSVLYQPEAEGD